jgi:citrate lyase subunit beta/citryl-CoA lyase
VLLIPQIESARALLRCEDIATASSRIAGLSVGGEDYTANLGVPRTPGGAEIAYARGVIVNCSVAYRLLPLDVIYPVLHDEAGLLVESQQAKAVGFKGKYLIHPEQVEPVNRIFSPSEEEVAAARRVIEAFDDASSRGQASVQVDGRMVDIPVAKRARDLIALAEAISAKT